MTNTCIVSIERMHGHWDVLTRVVAAAAALPARQTNTACAIQLRPRVRIPRDACCSTVAGRVLHVAVAGRVLHHMRTVVGRSVTSFDAHSSLKSSPTWKWCGLLPNTSSKNHLTPPSGLPRSFSRDAFASGGATVPCQLRLSGVLLGASDSLTLVAAAPAGASHDVTKHTHKHKQAVRESMVPARYGMVPTENPQRSEPKFKLGRVQYYSTVQIFCVVLILFDYSIQTHETD